MTPRLSPLIEGEIRHLIAGGWGDMAIALSLGISNVIVWKRRQHLRAEGFDTEITKNYRCDAPETPAMRDEPRVDSIGWAAFLRALDRVEEPPFIRAPTLAQRMGARA